MARGRIFSSRRMFSSRRAVFVAPSKQAGPFGFILGVTAAVIIIFGAGMYTGRAFPNLFALTSHAPAAPLTAAEF